MPPAPDAVYRILAGSQPIVSQHVYINLVESNTVSYTRPVSSRILSFLLLHKLASVTVMSKLTGRVPALERGWLSSRLYLQIGRLSESGHGCGLSTSPSILPEITSWARQLVQHYTTVCTTD